MSLWTMHSLNWRNPYRCEEGASSGRFKLSCRNSGGCEDIRESNGQSIRRGPRMGVARLLCGTVAALSLFCASALASERYCTDTGVRTLRVAMYPFIPDREGAAFHIKEAFEEGCPGLTLNVSFDDNYYHSDKKQGILHDDADVYEVDSVFFADFVNGPKIQAPSKALIAAAGTVVPFAGDVATSGGVQFGIPHWLCSDFLIYRKDLPQVGTIKSPADAQRIFASAGAGNGLLMDLSGSSTLGELYLSILVAHYRLPSALQKLEPGKAIDDYALGILKSFVGIEAAGYGRSADYHGRDGFYPRQFVRRAGGAFVGYSEELHSALTEATQSCRSGECVQDSDIEIGAWPFAAEQTRQTAWVDMYMLDSRLTGAALRDAEAFITFMMRTATYEELLAPENEAPRYLLPAREEMYADPKLKVQAPLYQKFRPLIDQAIPVTAQGLNDRLRAVGASIDAALPANH